MVQGAEKHPILSLFHIKSKLSQDIFISSFTEKEMCQQSLFRQTDFEEYQRIYYKALPNHVAGLSPDMHTQVFINSEDIKPFEASYNF